MRKYGRTIVISILILNHVGLSAQDLKLRGVVSGEGKPLPFATLGILNQNVGTIADEHGQFELNIPQAHLQDTLIVAYLGFKSGALVPALVSSPDRLVVDLNPDTISLRPVIVWDQKAKSHKIGGKKDGDTFVWVSAKGKGAEVTSLMKPKWPMHLIRAGVQVYNKTGLPFRLLVNLYEQDADTGLPGKALLNREVILKSSQKEGWVSVDLDQENLVLDHPFFVAFKWIDVADPRPQIAINGKLRCFTRYVALGEWQEIFHWNIRAEGVRIRRE